MPQPPLPLPTTLLPALIIVGALLGVGLSAKAQAQAAEAPPERPRNTAHATPASPDAMLKLLQEKGLLPTAVEVREIRDTASNMVMSAMNFLGVPYRRGGSSATEGFDCSGFTRHVFEHSIGLVLPRRADQQAKDAALQGVKREELKPGDLVFFNTMRRAFSHVGIYIGEGRFIHAPRSGGEVRIEDMRQAYWSKRFNGARRPDMAPVAAVALTPANATAPAATGLTPGTQASQ